MKEEVIKFNNTGHDGFIDFIKAYAIIMVVFGHLTPSIGAIGYNLWGGGRSSFVYFGSSISYL